MTSFAEDLQAAVASSIAAGEMTDELGALAWSIACKTAHSRGVPADEVEDAASLAICRLMSRWRKLGDTPRPHNMLATIVANATIDWQRSRGRHWRLQYCAEYQELPRDRSTSTEEWEEHGFARTQ